MEEEVERGIDGKKRGRELEKLEEENLKIIEEVYNASIKDKEIQKQIEKIKEHEWVKIIEGDKNGG